MAKGKYHDWLTLDGLTKLQAWARDGLTNEQIAKNIGINPDTLYTWLKKYTEIDEALKRGKEVVDFEVENALLKNAMGFEYEETKTIVEITPDGEKKQRVEKTKKFSPPNTTAQIFWLKNRKPAEWRDKQEINATVSSTGKLDSILEQLSDIDE